MSNETEGAREALVEQLAEAIVVGQANAALTGENPLGELLDVVDEEIAAQVEAAVSVSEFSVHQWQQSYLSATEHAREQQARAESAEADIRALREAAEKAATILTRQVGCGSRSGGAEVALIEAGEVLDRALLAPSPAEGDCNCGYGGFHEEPNPRCDKAVAEGTARTAPAPSPAEGTGEVGQRAHDDAEWDEVRRIARRPAPVSSGEAGEPWVLYCAEEYEVLSGRVRNWQGAVKESAAERLVKRLNADRPVGATTLFRVALTPSSRPAPVVTPSAEDGQP